MRPRSDSVSPQLRSHPSFIQDRAGRMGGETPELGLEQVPQDASTKKLSECLKRIGDELDSNMELQRCGPWDPGVQRLGPFSLRTQESQLPTPTSTGRLESSPLFFQTQRSRVPSLNSALWTPSLPVPWDLETLLHGVFFPSFYLAAFRHKGLF